MRSPSAAAAHPLFADDLERVHATVGRPLWERLRHAHVLLTGGTGFIGKWMFSSLLDASARDGLGCRVSVLTRDARRFRAAAPHLALEAAVELVEGDVRSFDRRAADAALGHAPPVTHIVHAATDVADGAGALETFDTCVDGTRSVMDLAARHRAAVLVVSSGAVYGRQPPGVERIGEDYSGGPDPTDPAAAYAEGKRASEWIAAAQGARHGLHVAFARCFALVGPYLPLDRHFAIGNFLRDALAGTEIRIRGDGTPVRSYLHAADMAAWLWTIFLAGPPGRAYNVGGVEGVSIEQLARRVVRVLGSTSRVELAATALADAPVERYVPDVGRAMTELGLPDPWTLDEAVERTARWHSTQDRR